MLRSVSHATMIASMALALGCFVGCKKSTPPPTPVSSKDDHTDHDHDHADHDHADHDHADHDQADHDHADHDHGSAMVLGEQKVGAYTVKASRDGDVTPGGDAPIDIWITGGEHVAAVRCWVGTADAKGSMKAKADLEKDMWHAHTEIPAPLPAGSRLWIEIEDEKGQKQTAEFDLKA